ncbi:MAG: dihydrofolate reductase [Saprospiraceae bacterium]|nr:dihydrofolate reductase [Saprospiraceae bacterium]
MKKISIIVAITENDGIGLNNDLLYYLPEDLKRFKKLTSGNVVVMGKNTYLSLPKRPLPNRVNIVISDDKNDDFEGCVMAYSIEEAIEKFDIEKENFIIGGASIYKQFLQFANKFYLTRIHTVKNADTFLAVDFSNWKLIEEEKINSSQSDVDYSYLTYERLAI